MHEPATNARRLNDPTIAVTRRSSTESSHDTDIETAAPHRTDAESGLDRQAIRFAYVRGRQAEGADDARFHVRREDGVLAASSPERGVRGRFRADGVEVASERARGRLRTRSLRCDDVVTTADETSFEVARTPHRAERRVTSGALAATEWIESGPLGLEHGFDVDGRCDALAIAIEVEGLAVERAGEQSGHVKLVSEDGVLQYAELFAVDADQHALPARFVVADARITLEVDTSSARWPVTVDPLLYVEDQRVGPPVGLGTDGAPFDRFGASIAIEGELAIVGTPEDDIGALWNRGSVHVLARTAGGWQIVDKLVADDGSTGAQFGTHVAISEGTVLVGAPTRGLSSGAAYVFVRVGGAWQQQAKLSAVDRTEGDFFGTVALSGDTAVIGAPGADSFRGAAYVFQRSGTSWRQRAKLIDASGDAGDRLGLSLAIRRDTILIAAPNDDEARGAVHAFGRVRNAWRYEGSLRAGDGAPYDYFGHQIAIDGEHVIVGAPFSDELGDHSGCAYVFSRSESGWVEAGKLTPSDGGPGMQFGASVAFVANQAVIGALESSTHDGSAYVFARVGGAWEERAKLVHPNPRPDDRFALSVATTGSDVLVGAPFDESGIVYPFTGAASGWRSEPAVRSQMAPWGSLGSAIALDDDTALVTTSALWIHRVEVLQRVGGSWNRVARLEAPDRFGSAIALDDGRALVASAYGASGGFVAVFGRSGGTWTLEGMLEPADAPVDGSFSATSVALDGDTALAGVTGAVYVFSRVDGVWSQQAKLTGNVADRFGDSVALFGDTALVGAPRHSERGAAYIFEREGSTWVERATLSPATAASDAGDAFGHDVALVGDTALIGAPRSFDGRGVAHVFVRSDDSWAPQATLIADDGENGDAFGGSVALAEGRALIGASGHDGAGTNAGAAYYYSRLDGGWSLTARLIADQPNEDASFGQHVALSLGTTLVAAPGAYGPVPFGNLSEGAVYFGSLRSADGQSCADDSSCTSGFCVDGVCCDTPCGGGSTDDCEACSVAAGAAADGLCAPTTGNACDDEVSCTESDSCNVGVCSGTVVCEPCPAGTWSEDGSDRTSCQPCDAGTWSVSGATACVAWTVCSPGSFLASSGSATNDATCAACALGTFSATSNALACAPWSDCGEGRFETMAATTTSDRACASCSRCRRDELEASPCTATRDTVCVGRDAGVGLDGGGSDAGALDAGAASDGGLLDGAIVATDAGDASMDAEADAASEGGVSGGGGCGCTTGATGRAPSFGMLFLFGWVAERLTRRTRSRSGRRARFPESGPVTRTDSRARVESR
jgi:hypothetical protein